MVQKNYKAVILKFLSLILRSILSLIIIRLITEHIGISTYNMFFKLLYKRLIFLFFCKNILQYFFAYFLKNDI